jgi:hypothetical protein
LLNIDPPSEFLEMLDRACDQRGVTRQTLVKFILYEWLRPAYLEEHIALFHNQKAKKE